MTTFRLGEVFTPDCDWQVQSLEELSEAERKALPQREGKTPILGRVRGQFFCPDGFSRNGRFYPKSLWEKVIEKEEVRSRLRDRLMFGCIGHDEQPVSEEQLRKGEVSHIVTALSIDGGKGIGEALILDTPAGRCLETYLRAGCRLKTSSRASGRYKDGAERDGMPVVDEDSYQFETFDFVVDPGFLEANPSLVERLGGQGREESQPMPNETDKAFVEELQASRRDLQKQLSDTIAESAKKDATIDRLQRALKAFTGKRGLVAQSEKLGIAEDDVARLPRVMEELGCKSFADLVRFVEAIDPKDVEHVKQGHLGERLRKLKLYETHVAQTPKEAVNLADAAAKLVESYRKFGKPEEIAEKLAYLERLEKAYAPVGNPVEARNALRDSIAVMEAYAPLGKPDEIRAAMVAATRKLREYKEIGEPDEIRRTMLGVVGVLESLSKLGGIPRLKKLIRKWNESVSRVKEVRISRCSEKLSEQYSIPVTDVRKLVEKVGSKEAESLLAVATKRGSAKAPAPNRTASGSRLAESKAYTEPMFESRRSGGFVGQWFGGAAQKMGKG